MIIMFPLLVILIGLAIHFFCNGFTRSSVGALGIPTYFAGLLFLCYIYAPEIIEVIKTHR